uniref:Tc1-like transposase DDE domain-containing protein n=1 Tax=Acrobeloides nanus TaxID=290746 RepID=A0A914E7I6_9BILA
MFILSIILFVKEGVKINRWNYMEMLEELLLPWASDLFGDEEWCFQQDSDSAHKANEIQDWLSEHCPDCDFITREEWPPNSPDLNSLDYAVWSIMEEKACAKPHKDVESLKRALIKASDEINVLEKIVDNFPKRLKACVEAKGGHFE